MKKILSLLLLVVVLAGCTGDFIVQKTDDWEYEVKEEMEMMKSNLGSATSGNTFSAGNQRLNSPAAIGAATGSMAMAESDAIGFAVGGANDINNFRENIENGYLPIPTDLTYEGLFYDYYFDTGQTEKCNELFCPSYAQAVTKDPLSEDEEYYLSVGLNSGIKESDFQRKKLNLMIVIDISGSMGSRFNNYYYDDPEKNDQEESNQSKMEIAKESVVGLLGHLNNDDRFGVVLFDDGAYIGKKISKVSETDMGAIYDHIKEIQDRGGTNMEAGYKQGTELFDEYLDTDADEYENRIIFLTDAMPNTGRTDEESLMGMTKKNAENGIYSTFIGIGVDFNTELIEKITKIRGANYYSVHNKIEFNKRMVDEFEYMVTPLVFDLKLALDAEGWDIERVYGSPEANEASGEIMYVNTLFPSSTEGGETKGGIIILKLKKTGEAGKLKLSASYQDRTGEKHSNEKEIVFENKSAESFDNNGIRKAILLARYANLTKSWIIDERKNLDDTREEDREILWEDSDTVNEDFAATACIRCPIPLPPIEPELGRWERQSVDLTVSEEYQEIFEEFKEYFKEESDKIGDESLEQELEILEKLANYNG